MASIGPPALGAKGCVERLHPTGETTHYDLCVAGAPANHVRCASLRSGGRRLAVRKTIEYQIGALPCTPFPAVREFPSRGNERYEGKNSESYTSGTISAFSPFGGWRHHLARWEACHLILSRLRLLANRVTRFPVEKVRRSRIGGGERSVPIRRMLIMLYDTGSKSRNADFISIAREGQSATLSAAGAVAP